MGMRRTGPLRHLAAALAFAALWLSLSHVHEAHDDRSAHEHGADVASLHAGHAGHAGVSGESDAAPSDHDSHCSLESAPHVSSDDDHHEHSSRVAVALEACFACRSSHDDELLADASPSLSTPNELGRPIPSDRDAIASAALEGLPDPRAPPVLSGSTSSIS